jgi:nucleoside-diphosphate-sugar epimerase
MKILVIGGTGLVGSYLLPKLIERGNKLLLSPGLKIKSGKLTN